VPNTAKEVTRRAAKRAALRIFHLRSELNSGQERVRREQSLIYFEFTISPNSVRRVDSLAGGPAAITSVLQETVPFETVFEKPPFLKRSY